jgi:GxxExxY protein
MISEEELTHINALTERIIGCAIEVHRGLGPGLLEHTYEAAMCIELRQWGMAFERQAVFPIDYKGIRISEHRVDLIVESRVVVELKSVDRFDPVFEAQVLTYLRCTGLRVGLLINFNGRVLRTGVRRFLLDHLRASAPLRLRP